MFSRLCGDSGRFHVSVDSLETAAGSNDLVDSLGIAGCAMFYCS